MYYKSKVYKNGSQYVLYWKRSIKFWLILIGIPDEHSSREGLFDTITRSKSHYQKRAYQCIKLLVALFSQCSVAKQLLDTSTDIKRKWSWAVEWLNDELERGRGPYPGSGQYSYSNWSPPAQSNETANGYFLERSHSARQTLERACELLPDEVSNEYYVLIWLKIIINLLNSPNREIQFVFKISLEFYHFIFALIGLGSSRRWGAAGTVGQRGYFTKSFRKFHSAINIRYINIGDINNSKSIKRNSRT